MSSSRKSDERQQQLHDLAVEVARLQRPELTPEQHRRLANNLINALVPPAEERAQLADENKIVREIMARFG